MSTVKDANDAIAKGRVIGEVLLSTLPGDEQDEAKKGDVIWLLDILNHLYISRAITKESEGKIPSGPTSTQSRLFVDTMTAAFRNQI